VLPCASRSTSDDVTPCTSIIFVLLVAPVTMRTPRRGTPRRSARNATSASFAAPSTGGAWRRTRSAPPTSPTISSR